MNKLLKTLIYDDQLSLSILETTDMVNDAIKIHKLSPLASATLGRTMTVCTFMASNLKNQQDKLSVVVSGDGVGGKVTVCGNGDLNMRGYIDNPNADLPLKANGKLDVGGCVGKNGRITVTKSMGLKEPYSESCKLVNGEIAEDFTAYYAYSEQQPTAIALGVKIGKNKTCVGAGGVIIQALPNASEENIIKAEQMMNNFSQISTLIEQGSAEKVLKDYFGEINYTEYRPEYKCLCSKEYIEGVLLSLGKKQLYDLIEQDGQIKVDCQFCEKQYVFNKEDIDKIVK